MPIERTENPDGSWEEKATDAQSVRDLLDKRGQELIDHGREEYHQKYKKWEGIGTEKLIGPNGEMNRVRLDQVDSALKERGYSPMNKPRTVVPALPWQTDREVGETWTAYMRRKAETPED